MAASHSVVIVDDHPLFRQGLRQAVEGDRLQFVGEAGDGEAALKLIAATSRHCVST